MFDPPATPAFIYDEVRVQTDTERIAGIVRRGGGKFLYSPKANSVKGVLEVIASTVDGFAASSVYEARFAKDILNPNKVVHLTNPGLRADEALQAAAHSDYISFNSLSQWESLGPVCLDQVKCGLRINPGLSLVRDSRYDPCRKASKLGVSLDVLADSRCWSQDHMSKLSGLHFHTNSDATTFSGLLSTIRHIIDRIEPTLRRMEWINVGGGYLFDDPDSFEEFYHCLDILKGRFGLDVFVEPGAAVVRNACYLIATVVDIFVSDTRNIAVLDASTNHWPEVFEYEFAPDVIGDEVEGEYEYLIAGSTCLAGDLFGTYAFTNPLVIGSKVVFCNAGAYSIVKAHYFNGIKLPTIYAYTSSGKLIEKKAYSYDDFVRQSGGVTDGNH